MVVVAIAVLVLLMIIVYTVETFLLKFAMKITDNDSPLRDCALIAVIPGVVEIIMFFLLGKFLAMLIGLFLFFFLLKKVTGADFFPDCILIAMLVYGLGSVINTILFAALL